MNPPSADARSFIRRFAGRRILVVGDIMLDEYIWGTVARISPEAPVPIVDVNTVSMTPGGAANVAANLKSLGADPLLVGLIGHDETADRLRRSLAEAGISPDYLVTDLARPTTLKTRIVAHGQQMIRADRESRQPLDSLTAATVANHLDDLATEAEAILISDYGKGLLIDEIVGRLIRRGRVLGRPVSVDPKGLFYDKYRGANIVTPNAGEAALASRREIHTEADLLEAGRRLLAELGTEAILVTRGEKGMSLFESGERVHHLPTYAREVFDVTGAGDTAIATLTLGLAAGASYRQAAELANRAAGVVVGKIGTASLTAAELEQALPERRVTDAAL